MVPRPLLVSSFYCATACVCALTPAVAQESGPRTTDVAIPASDALPRSTLKICLRLEDQSPFLGVARLRVLPETGDELMGVGNDNGEIFYYAVAPGTYTLDVIAPPFAPVSAQAQIQPGRQKTLIVVLKHPGAAEPEAPKQETELVALTTEDVLPIAPTSGHGTEAAPPAKTPIPVEPPKPKEAWKPVDWKNEGTLDSGVACPVNKVLHVTGEHVREFVTSMEKFTATETVEHYPVDKNGERKTPETRKFSYVVTVNQDKNGTFGLQEFRNGSTDNAQFPANIATMGLPAIVLVFHPDYAGDFQFDCDGMVHVRDHDYWELRFAQREDRPVRIESYVVNGSSWPIYLQGRAWIDPGKGEVVRLESQLMKPIPQIELWQQHQVIDYTPVKFASTGQEVWLPQAADVYVERHNKRYYRSHSFRDFILFNVDTTQSAKAPKGSYSFTNLTDSDMTGELTVMPVDGISGGPVILRFAVPARRTIIKTVGPGKDVNLPIASVASAKFVHSGDNYSVKVEVNLARETTLDVIPESAQANP
jgi:hypothetical protein